MHNKSFLDSHLDSILGFRYVFCKTEIYEQLKNHVNIPVGEWKDAHDINPGYIKNGIYVLSTSNEDSQDILMLRRAGTDTGNHKFFDDAGLSLSPDILLKDLTINEKTKVKSPRFHGAYVYLNGDVSNKVHPSCQKMFGNSIIKSGSQRILKEAHVIILDQNQSWSQWFRNLFSPLIGLYERAKNYLSELLNLSDPEDKNVFNEQQYFQVNPNNYATCYLKSKLETYRKQRSQENIHVKGLRFFGNTLLSFGYSKKQKMDASQAFLTELKNLNNKKQSTLDKKHYGALHNGRLGTLFGLYEKHVNETVSFKNSAQLNACKSSS